MKQEYKELLLRYLSMALPYGVKVRDDLGRTDKLILGHDYLASLYYEGSSTWMNYKPYLRSISGMTEEEEKEYDILCNYNNSEQNAIILLDWLLKKHFDIFGLIPRGLAVEVTKENNPYNIAEK